MEHKILIFVTYQILINKILMELNLLMMRIIYNFN